MEQVPTIKELTPVLRPLFAGLAMQGILAKVGVTERCSSVADEAVAYADALIAQLTAREEKS